MRELLLSLNYDVKLLVSLDFAPYGTTADIGHFNLHYNYQKMRHWLHQLHNEIGNGLSFASFIAAARSELRKRIKKTRRKYPNQPNKIECEIDIPSFFTNDEKGFVSQFDKAVRKYRYHPSFISRTKLNVLAFTSTKEPDRSLYNVEKKWRQIILPENLEVISICGTHRDIAERPNVLLLANHLRTRLDILTYSHQTVRAER